MREKPSNRSWPFHARAGLNTYATNMVPDVALLTEGLHLFITTDMIEFQGFLNDSTSWANGDAIPTRTTVPLNGLIQSQGNVGENADQPDSCAEFRGDQEIISPNPTQSCLLGDVFMGQMASLSFPIDHLRGGNGQGIESLILDMKGNPEGHLIEEDVHPLIMEEV